MPVIACVRLPRVRTHSFVFCYDLLSSTQLLKSHHANKQVQGRNLHATQHSHITPPAAPHGCIHITNIHCYFRCSHYSIAKMLVYAYVFK